MIGIYDDNVKIECYMRIINWLLIRIYELKNKIGDLGTNAIKNTFECIIVKI